MGTYPIPVVKAKGESRTFDSEVLPVEVYTYALQLGLKTLLNRGMPVAKDYDTEAEFRAAVIAKADENVTSIMEGKVRIVGFTKVGKIAGKVMVEAKRLAREFIRDQLKAAGEKLSHYTAKDITEAAVSYLESEDGKELLDQAKQNLAEREAVAERGKGKVDIKALVKPDAQKVAKLEAESKRKKEVLSKTTVGGQGGRPAVTRGSTRPSA